MTEGSQISHRKMDHIKLCCEREVEFERTTMLELVELEHCALPDLAEADLDLGTEFMGKRLAAPLMITAITGGIEKAAAINRDLAAVAERMGIAFGFGSQRPMLVHPESHASFQVRDVAPTILLLGNLGMQQARHLDNDRFRRLVDASGLDGIAIHLNPAMELHQPEGDRNFRGGRDLLERLARSFPDKILVKETGCGISARVADVLKAAGIRHVDVAGAGGTSWVKVELHRAPGGSCTANPFAEWGIPTAVSLLRLAPMGFNLVASGGIRTGLDAAKALALGARIAGMALPIIKAYEQGGTGAVETFLTRVKDELARTMLLTGCRTIQELRQQPVILLGNLYRWLHQEPGSAA